MSSSTTPSSSHKEDNDKLSFPALSLFSENTFFEKFLENSNMTQQLQQTLKKLNKTFSSKEFSNARLVRNLYERTWGKAAYRQSLEGGDIRILKSDLVGAMADGEFKKLLKKNAERTMIGFNANKQ